MSASEQELYRQRHRYRIAWLREDGAQVMVDDLTFDEAIHSGEPLEPPHVIRRASI
jgi:hypothetical protein